MNILNVDLEDFASLVKERLSSSSGGGLGDCILIQLAMADLARKAEKAVFDWASKPVSEQPADAFASYVYLFMYTTDAKLRERIWDDILEHRMVARDELIGMLVKAAQHDEFELTEKIVQFVKRINVFYYTQRCLQGLGQLSETNKTIEMAIRLLN